VTEDQREIRRKKRVIEYAGKIRHVGKACRHFGIARSTFYLWRDRYHESGDEGLTSRRRGCPHNYPNKIPADVVEKILHLRRTYHMGPIRIVWYLERYLYVVETFRTRDVFFEETVFATTDISVSDN